MGNIEDIIKPAEQNEVVALCMMGKDTEHLVTQRTLGNAVVEIQAGLGTPA